jgi:RNA-directed DNA polymerase
LGFIHIYGTNYRTGKFTIQRKTIGKSLTAKLKEIRAQLPKRMHTRLPGTKKWMQQVAREYFQYHPIPANFTRLRAFRKTRTSWVCVFISACSGQMQCPKLRATADSNFAI